MKHSFIDRIRRSLAVRDWLHEARGGVIRLPRNAQLITHEAYRSRERNAFVIGRDYHRSLDEQSVQPLTTALHIAKGA